MLRNLMTMKTGKMRTAMEEKVALEMNRRAR
jgi:hypothetical protein